MIRLVRNGLGRGLTLGLKGSWSSVNGMNNQMSMKMNEKIEAMKQTIAKTTPRSFSLLFLLASVPAFYFINQLIQKDYANPQFTNNSNIFYKYYYLYNMTFLGCSMCLTKFNFHSPSSRYTLPKAGVTAAVIPLMFSFVGLMLPQTDSKHSVWLAVGTQVTTMLTEGTMANKGMLPFWFYSHRHYIGLFYLVMFVINYNAMSRLAKRRKTHSHQFVDVEKGL